MSKGEKVMENLGKIVHDGTIYDLDDINSTEKLEQLLNKLNQEEADIKRKIDESIKSDLEERE